LSGATRLVSIYGERRVLAVFFMGFSSGLPLPLTFGTLSFWLAEAGVSRTEIGLFALVGGAYSLKFLWAPLIDRLALPGLTGRLGRRRGWALLIQALLIAAIVALGMTNPAQNPWPTALAAVIVAFLSASQDIVIDAYRIELLDEAQQGAGAAATQWGYRFGLLAAGAGALYAAEYGGWPAAFAIMAALMGVGIVTVLMTREPAQADIPASVGVANWLKTAVIAPFADFLGRPHWAAILLFVVLYKFGDALAGVMTNPFYVDLGFSKTEVANVSKIFGVIATLVGVAAGGAMVYRLGVLRSLLIGGVLQGLSNLAYVAQAMAGHDVMVLTIVIFVENFCGGLGSAAFVAYLSGLCAIAFTATQYALLSSLASVGRTFLSSGGGWLSERIDWVPFFLATTAAALPGLLLLIYLMRVLPPTPGTSTATLIDD
jgi:PAT family beta-lactamase induction signal transducer AmpG